MFVLTVTMYMTPTTIWLWFDTHLLH